MLSINGLMALSPCAVDVGQWWNETRATFLPMDLRIDQDGPFEVGTRLARVPRACVVHVSAGDHSTSMGRATCDTLGRRLVKVIWQHHGTARIEQGARAVEVAAGNWTVYEPSRPFESQMRGQAEFSALLLDVTDDDRMLALSRRMAGRALPTEGAAAVALATIAAASSSFQSLDSRSHESVIDCVCDLLGQEVQRQEGGLPGARRRAMDAIAEEARRYVDKHLDEPDLTPDRIAFALNVSRRTLYNAFEAIGETPQAFVQRVRMERCRRILCEDADARASITQIALEVGFIDPGYFTRAFRRHFGRSPSQFRADQHALGNT